MVILVMLGMVVMVMVMVMKMMANIVKPKSELIRLQRWTFDRISQKKNEEHVCMYFVQMVSCISTSCQIFYFLHIFPVSTEYQKERGMTES